MYKIPEYIEASLDEIFPFIRKIFFDIPPIGSYG